MNLVLHWCLRAQGGYVGGLPIYRAVVTHTAKAETLGFCYSSFTGNVSHLVESNLSAAERVEFPSLMCDVDVWRTRKKKSLRRLHGS